MCIYIYIPSYMKNILAPKETALVTSYFPRLRRFRTVFFDKQKTRLPAPNSKRPLKTDACKDDISFLGFHLFRCFPCVLGEGTNVGPKWAYC